MRTACAPCILQTSSPASDTASPYLCRRAFRPPGTSILFLTVPGTDATRQAGLAKRPTLGPKECLPAKAAPSHQQAICLGVSSSFWTCSRTRNPAEMAKIPNTRNVLWSIRLPIIDGGCSWKGASPLLHVTPEPARAPVARRSPPQETLGYLQLHFGNPSGYTSRPCILHDHRLPSMHFAQWRAGLEGSP
jgi:hypothetical protein